MEDRRVKLGSAAVDSGQLMIVDPCYVLDRRDPGAAPGADEYERVCDAVERARHQGGQVMGGLAVAFRSGLGDGRYDVFATIGKIPGWGTRVKKIEIVMIEDGPADDHD